MPFGKFQGRPLAELPTRYLRWLVRQDFVRGRLEGEIAVELRGRGIDEMRERR